MWRIGSGEQRQISERTRGANGDALPVPRLLYGACVVKGGTMKVYVVTAPESIPDIYKRLGRVQRSGLRRVPRPLHGGQHAGEVSQAAALF